MNRGNGESKITDCNGRCRNGWVFGQGFDSPQVHLLQVKNEHKKSLGSLFPRLFLCFGTKKQNVIKWKKSRFRPLEIGANRKKWCQSGVKKYGGKCFVP